MPNAGGLYYFAHGRELKEEPPVLMIHGAGGDHLNWPPQIRRLGGRRIFALDLPGHGKSEGVGKQNILEYSRDVVDFMKAIRISAAVMVGFSMGSAIALALALKYPKRVLGLGLIGSGAKMRVAPDILEMAGNKSTHLAAVQRIVEASYSAEADERLKDLAMKQMGEIRQTVLYGDLLACDAFDVMENVKKVRTPTTLICGSEDQMTPPNRSEYLMAQINGAQMHLVEGAGHMVMQEEPNAVADLLAGLLDRIPT